MKKEKKVKNRTVLISKVILTKNMEIIGSGYMITKCKDGAQRLDVMDLQGNHIIPGNYDIQIQGEPIIGIDPFSIN